MLASSTTGWFLRAAATSGVILMACWIAPRFLTYIPEFPAVTTDEQHFGILRRFLQEPIPDTVLIGSSLTYHLKENYFAPGTVRNIGLAGHSPLTGLAILEAETARKLHVVAIESNILFPAIDHRLIELAARLRQEQRWLPPIRTLAAYYQDLSETRKENLSSDRARSALADPGSFTDGPQRIAEVLMKWDTPVFDQAVLTNLPAIKKLVEQLEARGVIVLFYELPIAPTVARYHYPEIARGAFYRSFSQDDTRWLDLDYPADQIRWTDGIHLDQRSALLVSMSMEKAIASKLASLRGRQEPTQ
jgi:hypothetical protein